MGSDRRDHKRVAARLRVAMFDSKGNKRMALARNLSAGGVECDFSINKGALVKVEFTIPVRQSFKTIRATCKVVNVVYRGVVGKMALGLEFTDIEDSFLEAIHAYAKERVAI